MKVEPATDGRLNVEGLLLEQQEVAALYLYFQQRDDRDLKRTRYGSFLIYRYAEGDDPVLGCCIRVFNEATGEARTFWDRGPVSLTREGYIAQRWFDNNLIT